MFLQNSSRGNLAMAWLCLLVLSACGGGGGNDSGATSTPSQALLVADCSGLACAATDGHTYSGNGIGAWAASNTTQGTQEIAATISGALGRTATLVWTNLTGSPTGIPSSVSAFIDITEPGQQSETILTRIQQQRTATITLMSELVKRKQSNLQLSTQMEPRLFATNDMASWYDSLNRRSLATTLRSQKALSNGRYVNVWVEDSEWDPAGTMYKVTQGVADLVGEKFALPYTGIFDMVTGLAGSLPWGAHGYPADLIGATQDIQIVVANLSPDSSAGGLLGFYDSTNSYRKSAHGDSNEALLLFIDSESLVTAYQDMIISTLGHEFMHMINFYQRTVMKSVDGNILHFETWLEEMTAMMAQDIIDTQLGSFHFLRDNFFPCWVTSYSLNSNLNQIGSGYYNYCAGGSYSGYLLRQYGVGFFRDLVQSDETDSIAALDEIIRKYNGNADYRQAMRRWGASLALLDSSQLPEGYGYPQRSQAFSGITYTLPAINGPDYAWLRRVPALPPLIEPYTHAVETFTVGEPLLKRKITLPPGSAITLIIN